MASGRAGSRPVCRRAAARLGWPASRSGPTARLRRLAITRGRLPLRARHPNVRSGRRGRRRGRQSGRERHKKAQDDDNKNRDDDVASEPHENPRTTVFRRVGFATSWTQQPASREPAHTIPGVWCVDPDPHLTESSRPPDRRTMAVTMPQRIVGSSCQLHSAAEKRRSIRPVQVLKLIRIVCQPMPTVATRCYSIQSAILHPTCTKGCSCWSPVVRNRLRVFVDVEEVAGSIPAAPTSANG